MNFKTVQINNLAEIKTVTNTEAKAIKGGAISASASLTGPKGRSASASASIGIDC